MTINKILHSAILKGASDLHCIPRLNPVVRIHGDLVYLTEYLPITTEEINDWIEKTLPAYRKKQFSALKQIDFSLTIDDFYRIRISLFHTYRGISAAFRLIAQQIQSIDALDLPVVLKQMGTIHQGLILVCGSTGSGKSTTLAAIIHEIYTNNFKHIITLEDPIEFIYPLSRSIIQQRELHKDINDWQSALRSTLRQDPDIILLGEIRDIATLRLAINAAETGHLVLSTMHSASVIEAISRMITLSPAKERLSTAFALSNCLQMLIAQKLIKRSSGGGRVALMEILLNIPSVAHLIRENKWMQIPTILETQTAMGMQTTQKHLQKLWENGVIDEVVFKDNYKP